MPRVLVIDDDQVARSTSSILLNLEGFECVTAADGRTGLALALDRPFDLVLVDLHLPDLAGCDVAQQLKASGVACPVIVVTAFPALDTCFRSAKAGADAYIAGPLFNEDLLAIVHNGYRRLNRRALPEPAARALRRDHAQRTRVRRAASSRMVASRMSSIS
jgi:DNA-binding response OmpR family regulator